MTKSHARRGGSVALLIALMLSVQGYEIWLKHYIHESMTAAAKRCYDRSANRKPEHCDTRLPDNGAGIDFRWIDSSSNYFVRLFGYGARYPTLDQAVRWPDDPTRQMAMATLPKFGLSMKRACRGLTDKPGGKVNSLEDGLLCNSHMGRMQFFHAQADTTGVPATVTYEKIMRWAEFLYAVAALRTNDELDVSYCASFQGDDPFNTAMVRTADGKRCGPDFIKKWRLTDFFTFECENPFASNKCGYENGTSRFNKTRIVATGALLHLIQDSYSQSHCARGACGARDIGGTARVECKPIAVFTTYTGQNEKLHGKADRVPVFGASCRDSSAFDDPVTASAKVLWHISRHSKPAEFLADFERVFGTPRQIESARASDTSVCFAPSG